MFALTFFLSFFFTSLSASKTTDWEIQSEERLLHLSTLVSKTQLSPLVISLTLSDGSTWIVQDKNEQSHYQEIMGHWVEGDDIRLSVMPDAALKTECFLIKNNRSSEIVPGNLSPLCQDRTLASYIERIDENGYMLVTNRGDIWAIGWIGSFDSYRWNPKDRLIINKSTFTKPEDYLLINSRNGSSCWASLIHWK